jgi:hypothetical protein
VALRRCGYQIPLPDHLTRCSPLKHEKKRFACLMPVESTAWHERSSQNNHLPRPRSPLAWTRRSGARLRCLPAKSRRRNGSLRLLLPQSAELLPSDSPLRPHAHQGGDRSAACHRLPEWQAWSASHPQSRVSTGSNTESQTRLDTAASAVPRSVDKRQSFLF